MPIRRGQSWETGEVWMNLLSEVKGTYPNAEMRFFPLPCMHCDAPPCTKVCPVAATYRNAEGIVGQVTLGVSVFACVSPIALYGPLFQLVCPLLARRIQERTES